jgi:hypothetical protein
MSDNPVPSSLDVRAQSRRALRVGQVRSLNTFDDELALNTAYASADMVAADATWSEVIQVRGYDVLVLMCEFTRGSIQNTAAGGFDIEVQCALNAQGPWFERHATFDIHTGTPGASGNVEIPAANQLIAWRQSTASDSVNIALDLRCIGHFMRFRPLAVVGTGTVTNSRIRVTGIRQMESI